MNIEILLGYVSNCLWLLLPILLWNVIFAAKLPQAYSADFFDKDIPAWLAEFSRRRTYAFDRLNRIPGISCVNVKGAFYLFPKISALGLKSMEFCAQLLQKHNVAAVPGIAFGADDFIRISYATSLENIQKGLDRIEAFAGELKRGR